MVNPFDILTLVLAAIVIAEPVLILVVAPRRIQKRNEERAVVVFETKLLPLLEESMRKLLPTLLPAPPMLPTQEEQEAAQAALMEQIGAAVKTEVGEAVAGLQVDAAKQFSKTGVDARTSFAAREEEFLQAVIGHKDGGIIVGAAVESFADISPKIYKMAVRGGPDYVGQFLAKHGDTLRNIATLGFAKKSGNNGKADKFADVPYAR